ncbi:MAG: c-type cytochrome [Polyangiaceae bacterium]
MRGLLWIRLLIVMSWLCCAGCERRTPALRPAQRHPAASPASTVTPPPAAARVPVAGDAARGRELVQHFECNRCHEGTGLANAPLSKNCFSCHEQIISGRFPVSAAALARFQPHVASAREAPSLLAIAERLEGAWIREYLLAPRDLRPKLTPTMPRLALDATQAADITAYLMRDAKLLAANPPPKGDVQRGRDLIDAKGCASCHSFGGVAPFTLRESAAEGSDLARAAALAPDLRFTRERFQHANLLAWLLDPRAMKPDTRMPNFGLAPDEAADVAAYILNATLTPEAPMPFTRLPVLTRHVSFEETNRRVFSRTCHHCHTDPESAGGDGGPGNTGGFGFAPRGVSFSSHASILSGYLDARGERHSLFEPLADGTPRLVAALLARHDETAHRAVDSVRGMPLGLPPLSAEDIQLVESWVAQGKPL